MIIYAMLKQSTMFNLYKNVYIYCSVFIYVSLYRYVIVHNTYSVFKRYIHVIYSYLCVCVKFNSTIYYSSPSWFSNDYLTGITLFFFKPAADLTTYHMSKTLKCLVYNKWSVDQLFVWFMFLILCHFVTILY